MDLFILLLLVRCKPLAKVFADERPIVFANDVVLGSKSFAHLEETKMNVVKKVLFVTCGEDSNPFFIFKKRPG
jgi:hypothetical protein